MKKWIVFVYLVVSIHGFSQINQDSLSKYSYSIFGFTPPTHSFFGSGFFIKRHHSLFFISAKHVVTGCIYGTYLKHFPKEMNIVIDSPKTLINTNVELIAQRDSCSISFSDSDFVVTKVNSRFMRYIKSIEAFIFYWKTTCLAGGNVISFALHILMKDCKFVNDSGFQI